MRTLTVTTDNEVELYVEVKQVGEAIASGECVGYRGNTHDRIGERIPFDPNTLEEL